MAPEKNDAHLPEYALVERQEMLRGVGYGDEALSRIQVGVVSSWGEVNPAASQLDKAAAAVKAGVWAGGVPAVLKELAPLLHGDATTVTGEPLAATLAVAAGAALDYSP